MSGDPPGCHRAGSTLPVFRPASAEILAIGSITNRRCDAEEQRNAKKGQHRAWSQARLNELPGVTAALLRDSRGILRTSTSSSCTSSRVARAVVSLFTFKIPRPRDVSK